MISIKKNIGEYRLWKKRNDEKNFREKLKNKKKEYDINRGYSKTDTTPYKVFNVPNVFSIVENSEETICFFNNLIKTIEDLRKKKMIINISKLKYIFKIQMTDVQKITGDALMYLLTVIKNTRNKKFLPINWVGDFPKDSNIKEFLQDSGFLEYMKTDKKNLIKTNEKIQIRTGTKYVYSTNESIDIRKEVIDFTMKKLQKNKTQVNFLFNILTEVITNIEHAYDLEIQNELTFEPSWYIMVENDVDKIKYTFMDNGLGIPTTVKKKIIEEILQKMNLDKEYKYIKSALDGTYKRTQTGKLERSTGLPDLYEKFQNKNISNLIIISNYAYYCEDKSHDLENYLTGTIICWEIDKENKNYENKNC